jgi:hypothetical protein
MNRGYIKLWRRVLDSPVLHERGKRFSRLEAWLYLCLNARGTDDPKTGLKRGQIEASVRFLSRAWLWSQGTVHNFISELIENSMLTRVERSTERSTERYAERFNICNYDTYNGTVNAELNAGVNAKLNETNKGIKKVKRTAATAEEKMPRPEDPCFVIFKESFKETFDAPYQYQQNDFVRLYRLRKSLELLAGVPEHWIETCQNYLSTPQSSHTLADLCVRYGTFKNSRLNQFGRPEVPVQPKAEEPKEKVEWRIGPDGRKVAHIVPIERAG